MSRPGLITLGVILAAAAALPATGRAATPVAPSDGATITDTHTPTFSVQLDSTVQADGEAAEHDPLISVTGSDGRGGTTTVAFCSGADNGGGEWSCSDSQHPLPNGLYTWSFTYTLHSCIVLPPIGTYQAPPSCSWFQMLGVGGIFRVDVPTPPPANTSLVSPSDGATILPPPTFTIEAPAQATTHIYVSLSSGRLPDGTPAGVAIYQCSGQTTAAGNYYCRDDTGTYSPGETYYWWAVVDTSDGGSWIYGPRSFAIQETSTSGGAGSLGGSSGSSGSSGGSTSSGSSGASSGSAGAKRARTLGDAPMLKREARYTGASIKETRLSNASYALSKILGVPRLVSVACWSPLDWASISNQRNDGYYRTAFVSLLMPRWVNLSPQVCRENEKLIHNRPATPTLAMADGVETLTHEMMHALGITSVRYGKEAEPMAECYAMQLSIILAVKLGVPYSYADKLAKLNLINYRTRPPSYRDYARCRENGAWDLFPGQDSPPWHSYRPST